MRNEKVYKNVKKVIIIVFLLMNIPNISLAINNEILESQKQSLSINDFLKEAEKYTNENLYDLNTKGLLESAMSGKLDNSKIAKMVLNLLGKEVKKTITTVGIVLIVIIIHSILKNICESLENTETSKIIYYVEYILIVTLIMANFGDIIKMITETIEKLTGMINILIPILITLLVATGNMISASVIQPILLFAVIIIGNIIKGLIIPFLLISVVLSIISNISDRVNVEKLSKFFKSTIVWILGVLLTFFVGILSLEGTLSSSIDGITTKTVKAATTTVIPVVGKVLGESVDTVLGCANILKNGVGIVGVVLILVICIAPIVRLTVLTGIYKLVSAVSEPIADQKIVKLLEQMGDVFKILLAILFTVSVLFIIGITIVINISNSSMMYR